MTDKERLEEARLMAEMLRVETRLPHDFPFDLVDWLVEQAERVQELEEDLTKYRNGFEFQLLINNSIKKQNKRYKRALEEISNADWNSEGLDAERELDKVTDVAFKALEGEE